MWKSAESSVDERREADQHPLPPRRPTRGHFS